MGAPDGLLVEVEFAAGTWTDVSEYVDWSAGVSTRFGRTSPWSDPQVATLDVTLDNTDGRFTPLRQTLVDGTAHPYWPNVLPRRRIRFGYTVGSTDYWRFTGFVRGWPPSLEDTRRPRVHVSAVDRLDQLSRVELLAGIRQEVTQHGPSSWWPLDDAAGSTSAAALAGAALSVSDPGVSPDGTITFGKDGPGLSANGTAVELAPSTYGPVLTGACDLADDWTIAAWVWIDSATTMNNGAVVWLSDGSSSRQLYSYSGGVAFADATADIAGGSKQIRDSAWHQLAVTYDDSAGTLTIYVDGVQLDTGTTTTFNAGRVIVGNTDGYIQTGGGRPFAGRVAHVQVYDSVLTAAELLAQHDAANGGVGETVHERVVRYLGYAGLASTDYDVDDSDVELGSRAQDGQSVAELCRGVAVSEGGGAAFYVTPGGLARFAGRHARLPGDPVLTLDAGADLAGDDYAPAFDDTQLANRITATRSTASGAASTQYVDDTDSQDAYGVSTDSFASYARADADVRHSAEYRLAARSRPAFRLPQVTLDLATATTAGLYVDLADVEIGSRIRIEKLYAAAAPRTQIDLIVEGWADQVDDNGYRVTFDASPADLPPVGLWGDDDTVNARWQADGMTLDGAIDADDTSIAVATASGKPTFTADADAYPLNIRIGEEVMTVTDAPSSSSSPQTLTVTRAAAGTAAAAQADGADVTLHPTDGWSI